MARDTKAKVNTVAAKQASGAGGVGVRPRPPVVVVVGHVDHGKTTLLDFIRKTTTAAREAGGITQAVGAYEIEHTPVGGGGANGSSGAPRKITFIDTPGHEAFSAMRSRGAQIADLAILVVAADEGPKPQTIEAIKILEETKTPFVVALNKIDKAGVSGVEKVKGELAAAGVLLEGYGGQVSYHAISAKTGEGVSDLLDLVLLSADVEDLKYDASTPARGFVLEARRDPRRGIEASIIIKDGILRCGDAISTATATGKIKILENFAGVIVDRLEPSAPAIVIGFETLPKVGEAFMAGTAGERGAAGELGGASAANGGSAMNGSAGAKSEKDSRVQNRARVQTPTQVPTRQVTGTAPKNAHTLNLILKASDGGSLEVLSAVLRGLQKTAAAKGGKEVHIVDESVGEVTDGDVRHAQATSSTIIGFKNRVERGARILADAQSIEIITSNIVYDLAKEVEDFLTGKRGPAAAGELEVLAIFNQEKPEKQLVGGRVLAGTFRPKAACDVLRRASGVENSAGPFQSFGTGRILGLREKKSEITVAEKGKEIGVLVSVPVLIQVGDKIVIKK